LVSRFATRPSINMSMAKAVAKGFGAICLAPVDRVDSAMPGSRAAYISRWPTQSRLGPLKSAIAAALGIGTAIYWPSDRHLARSEERRIGKEGVSTCRYR